VEKLPHEAYTELSSWAMRRIIFFLGIFLALTATARAQEQRLRVVATTSDLRSLAKAVGGEMIIVSSLVSFGERAEDYQPKLQDVGILKGARAILRAGSGIDPWFDKLLARASAKNGQTGIERGEPGHIDASLAVAATDPLAVSAGFARNRKASRDGSNPHYWLDPKSAEPITAAILETFSRLDPDNTKYFKTNRDAFLDRLSGKLREWDARLTPLKGEPMIAFHDDWNVFARRFGLNFVDFIAARDRTPPRRGKLAELAKLIHDRGIRLIVSEANEPEKHAARLAQQTGAKLVQLAGSVGSLPGTDDYISMFDVNVNALTTAGKK
jgi:ABC-type Zn uptake system ZnuABC Zn-binding protein ZnuA